MFLELLRRFAEQGRNVSDKPTSPNYAPTAFAKEDEAKDRWAQKAEFEQAMRDLFSADRIALRTIRQTISRNCGD